MRRRWQAGTACHAYAERPAVGSRSTCPLRGPAGPARSPSGSGEVAAVGGAVGTAGRGAGARIEYRKIGGRSFGSNLVPCRAGSRASASRGHCWARRPRCGLVQIAIRRAYQPELSQAAIRWVIDSPGDVWSWLARGPRCLAPSGGSTQRQRPECTCGRSTSRASTPSSDRTATGTCSPSCLTSSLNPARLTRTRRLRPAGTVSEPSRATCALPARPGLPEAIQRDSVRAEEFARRGPPGLTARFVVENEITYLAFPVPDAVVVFGGGYAVAALRVTRLAGRKDLVYWGDIDTHGFAILNRLRRRFPQLGPC